MHHPYIVLTRLDKPIGIWLVFFPAAWAVALAGCAEAGVDWAVLYACFIGAILTRSAGCILNDLADRRLDAQVARTANRPLASGAVSVRAALILLVLLGCAALGLALLLPPLVLWLSLLAVPLIAAYPFMKRITWWPQAFLGLTFNLSAPIGWAAATGELSAAAWWLYAGAVCWTFGYDTIYAIQDAADDARVGIKSSARALGTRTRVAVALSYVLFIACLAVAGVHVSAGWPYYIGLGAASAHLIWQIARLDVSKPTQCGALFRSNRWVGLVIALGAVALGLGLR